MLQITKEQRGPDDCLAHSVAQLAHAITHLSRELNSNAILTRIEQKVNTIMASQAESAAELRTANTQLRKIITDTAGLQPSVDALKKKIAELEELVASGTATQQELVDAIAETKSLTQAVDDNVPELPVQPPVA